jgi:tetratricopeptide (TPR) repeat protein
LKNWDQQLERNLQGIELERQGRVDEAIELYETNVSEDFEGNHPYDCLVYIYEKRKQYNEARRVLEKAIYVFDNIVNKERMDRLPKLNKFKKELSRLNELV